MYKEKFNKFKNFIDNLQIIEDEDEIIVKYKKDTRNISKKFLEDSKKLSVKNLSLVTFKFLNFLCNPDLIIYCNIDIFYFEYSFNKKQYTTYLKFQNNIIRIDNGIMNIKLDDLKENILEWNDEEWLYFKLKYC